MRRKIKNSWLTFPVLVTLTVYVTILIKKVTFRAVTVETTTPTSFAASSRSLAPTRHVTKSLAELGKMDEISKHILFLNHVPKSGSEVVVYLLQLLQGGNSFKHVRLKGGNRRRMSRLEQEQLVYEVFDTIRSYAVPLSFDKQMRFVNFTCFDRQSPTYINLIRNPADGVVNRFYYQNVRKSRSSLFKNEEVMHLFKKCFQQKRKQCYYESGKSYDLTIPYFCGYDKRCSILNDEWAFQTAKANAERYFSVTGILEEFNATLDLFERTLPQFFKGAKSLYERDLLGHYNNHSSKRLHISGDIRKYLKLTLVKEHEFYEWAKMRLFQQLKLA